LSGYFFSGVGMIGRETRQVLLVLAALVPARTAATQTPGSQHAGHFPIDSTWLSYDSTSKTVTFNLIAGLTGGAKSPFNFNGFTDGELTLTVPAGSTVVMPFVNDDGTPHSAEIISAEGTLPNMAGDPAIPKAYTRNASQGLAQGQKDTMRFKAEPAAEYRIFCGVPGHGQSGMWIRFVVSSEAAAPSVEASTSN
jgi:sulfocyanin